MTYAMLPFNKALSDTTLRQVMMNFVKSGQQVLSSAVSMGARMGSTFPICIAHLPSHIQLYVMQVDNGTTSECAALYNLENNTFVPYHVAELPICGGHTLLPDGRALIVGGE